MVRAAIDNVLIPEAPALVAEYYNQSGPFAGTDFETLGITKPNEIGTDDLLALTLLDVSLSPPGLRRVLGADAATLASVLAEIPTDVPLWEADDALLERAETLFTHLRNIPSVGAVVAGKILARKRPMLIPVIDKWVIAALRAPSDTYWRSIRDALQDSDRRGRIEACRATAPDTVSTLRLLDVVIWMQFSESDNARAARARVGLPVAPRRSA